MNPLLLGGLWIGLFLLAPPTSAPDSDSRPGLRTRWARNVVPERVHPEHPRPSLRRESWQSLNGTWEYAIRLAGESRPEKWDGEILVPFAVESQLSGVRRRLGPDQRLWYRRKFTVPESWVGWHFILRFEAVDWEAQLFIDGHRAGRHRGGYDGFSVDITERVTPGEEHELVVAVYDPTDRGEQPRGKQVLEPKGIWYTPVSGIWQTVWLEGVPRTAIRRVEAERLPGNRGLRISADCSGWKSQYRSEAEISFQGEVVARGEGKGPLVDLEMEEIREWSPDDPALYDVRYRILDENRVVDSVESYFGLRTVEVRPDGSGVPRIFLNGRPLFQLGLLDQGYWPDGLYTAPTDEALRHDLEVTKRLGFNLVRKHVKVEPERWYYHCDRIGLLVWQDIPSGGPFIGPNDPDAERTTEGRNQFKTEAFAIVHELRHHPSIVSWVLFNEGWGQHDTAALTELLQTVDRSRLVNAASGWTDRGVGQVHDLHCYPGPAMPTGSPPRVAILGEFGGLGLPLTGHTWKKERNWGYRSFDGVEPLIESYVQLIDRLRPLIARGLAAAVYTQTTDVEIEVNGVMTYDREVIKLDDPRVVEANRKVYLPPPHYIPVVPTSRGSPQTWRYRTTAPAEGWERPGFDDAHWVQAPGGFGRPGTPGAVIGTEWTGDEIWLRRSFALESLSPWGTLCLEIHHDEDAHVFLNGDPIAELTGYTTDYVHISLDEKASGSLAVGENVLAIHCRQTGGGQFIDAGFTVRHEIGPIPAPLPHTRHGHRMEFLGDELVVFGGFGPGTGRGKKETWIQDLKTRRWRRGPDLELGKAFFASVVVDGSIYAIGSSLERFDPAGNRWETVAPEGTFPKSHFGAAAIGRTIYAVGGFPEEHGLVSAFDLDSSRKVDVPPLPVWSPGDHFHFVVNLGGSLHVIGGLCSERGQGRASQHWVLGVDGWRSAAPTPAPTWSKFAAWGVVGDDLWIFDEEHSFRYRPARDEWTELEWWGQQVAMPGCAVRGHQIFVLGGTSGPETAAPFTQVYDSRAHRWRRAP